MAFGVLVNVFFLFVSVSMVFFLAFRVIKVSFSFFFVLFVYHIYFLDNIAAGKLFAY